ncbi:MAG: SpoIID/LytB domain-containing protein [Clostridia bacterium]|nr:SpoIID/LytB domain-containing protein [Clostridia bacterium]
MKKLTVLILVFIMLFTCTDGLFAEEGAYKDTLRVGISYGSKSEVWFSSDSEIYLTDTLYNLYIGTVPAGVKFKISVENGLISSDYFYPTASPVLLASGGIISCNDNAYRGMFEVANKNNTLTIVNVVNTEDYLMGVLGKEMSPSWPIEALKAQAVCARNFAIKHIGKHSSYNFDICATQDCQVYTGINGEGERTRQAVNETAGVLVEYNGKVVPLYYFSCDGGYTEDSENVWVTAEGYLRGKKDIYEKEEYATRYNWEKTYKKEEIEKILTERGVDIGNLKDIRIDEISRNNGVIRLTFVGDRGEKIVTKSSVRSYLSLNSNAFEIRKHTDEPVYKEETEEKTVYVLTSEGTVSVTNPRYALSAQGLYEIEYGTRTVEELADEYAYYTFNGHGWGHLVGMSQWGAYSMAVEGYTYKDILNFYFTDITIKETGFGWYEEADEAASSDEMPEWLMPKESWEDEEENDEAYDDTQWSDTGL